MSTFTALSTAYTLVSADRRSSAAQSQRFLRFAFLQVMSTSQPEIGTAVRDRNGAEVRDLYREYGQSA